MGARDRLTGLGQNRRTILSLAVEGMFGRRSRRTTSAGPPAF
jgi:hypothetical protein